MKPKNDVVNDYYNYLPESKPIEIVECENEFQSYGQWLKAVTKNIDSFDYFIFIEDDYVPATDYFDLKLITEYQPDTYLCSLVGGANDKFHCRISNGIISANTMRKVLAFSEYNTWVTKYMETHDNTYCVPENHQIAFSRYLVDAGVELKDYTSEYKVDFHELGGIIDFSSKTVATEEKIFSPIQNYY